MYAVCSTQSQKLLLSTSSKAKTASSDFHSLGNPESEISQVNSKGVARRRNGSALASEKVFAATGTVYLHFGPWCNGLAVCTYTPSSAPSPVPSERNVYVPTLPTEAPTTAKTEAPPTAAPAGRNSVPPTVRPSKGDAKGRQPTYAPSVRPTAIASSEVESFFNLSLSLFVSLSLSLCLCQPLPLPLAVSLLSPLSVTASVLG